MDRPRRFSIGSNNLVMILMADQNNGIVMASVTDHFDMDFRNERTRGIDNPQPSRARVLPNFRRDAVGTKYGYGAVGNFVERFDEDRTLCRQLIDHESVMDNFLPDVYGPSQIFKR